MTKNSMMLYDSIIQKGGEMFELELKPVGLRGLRVTHRVIIPAKNREHAEEIWQEAMLGVPIDEDYLMVVGVKPTHRVEPLFMIREVA